MYIASRFEKTFLKSPLLEMESYTIFQAHGRLVKLTPSFHTQKGLLKPQSWNYVGSVQFSCSVVSNFLWPHGLQHARPPCHHQLLEFTQTHVHWVGDAIQPSHPLSSPSPLAFNLAQHQGLFRWVGSSHQVAKVLEFQLQLQHQSFQWTFRTDFL